MRSLKIVILFISLFPLVSLAQEIPTDVVDGFKMGNSELIFPFLSEEVELIILEKEGFYSKDMTGKKLNNYFELNPPVDFNIVHKGDSPSGSYYAIGELYTDEEILRVYMLFTADESARISEIRIEEDD